MTFRRRLTSKNIKDLAFVLLSTVAACGDFSARCPDKQQAEKAGGAFGVCVQSANPWQCGSAATKIHCGEKSK